jgi:hypothetical protein
MSNNGGKAGAGRGRGKRAKKQLIEKGLSTSSVADPEKRKSVDENRTVESSDDDSEDGNNGNNENEDDDGFLNQTSVVSNKKRTHDGKAIAAAGGSSDNTQSCCVNTVIDSSDTVTFNKIRTYLRDESSPTQFASKIKAAILDGWALSLSARGNKKNFADDADEENKNKKDKTEEIVKYFGPNVVELEKFVRLISPCMIPQEENDGWDRVRYEA